MNNVTNKLLKANKATLFGVAAVIIILIIAVVVLYKKEGLKVGSKKQTNKKSATVQAVETDESDTEDMIDDLIEKIHDRLNDPARHME